MGESSANVTFSYLSKNTPEGKNKAKLFYDLLFYSKIGILNLSQNEPNFGEIEIEILDEAY